MYRTHLVEVEAHVLLLAALQRHVDRSLVNARGGGQLSVGLQVSCLFGSVFMNNVGLPFLEITQTHEYNVSLKEKARKYRNN
jgi:hypothetical protein